VRHDRDEILRLVGSWPAEGEEMVGADSDASRTGLEQIAGKSAIDMIAPLGRLDDGEATSSAAARRQSIWP